MLNNDNLNKNNEGKSLIYFNARLIIGFTINSVDITIHRLLLFCLCMCIRMSVIN